MKTKVYSFQNCRKDQNKRNKRIIHMKRTTTKNSLEIKKKKLKNQTRWLRSK